MLFIIVSSDLNVAMSSISRACWAFLPTNAAESVSCGPPIYLWKIKLIMTPYLLSYPSLLKDSEDKEKAEKRKYLRDK